MKDQIENSLAKSNLLYTLINSIPDFIYIKDNQSHFIVANQKLATVMHFDSPEDLVGKTDMDFYPKEMAEKFYHDEQEIIRSKKPLINCIESGFDENGNIIQLSTTKIPISNNEQEVIAIIGIGRDVTELKLAEEKIREREVQLANESGKTEVIVDILHNIGNVLNSINVSALKINEQIEDSKLSRLTDTLKLISDNQNNLGDYLQNDEKGRLIPDYLQKLAERLKQEQELVLQETLQLQKRLEVINHILELQQDVNRSTLYTKEERLEDMVKAALDILHSKIEHRGISIHLNLDQEINIVCIRSKIIHVFVNLIKNALESIVEKKMDGGLIEIAACQNDDAISIKISDNGVGIEPSNIKTIFNHGFTTKPTGYGFGLHSCANSVQELRGTIYAESKGKNKGCSFVINLPKQQPL
jgi:PAS domain S-box-containing protein